MSDLKNLKEDLRKRDWLFIAEDVIKYQNFKVDIAIKNIRGNASDMTKKNYVISGRHYLRTHTPYNNGNVGKGLYSALDEMLSKHIQPLTPKENEKQE